MATQRRKQGRSAAVDGMDGSDGSYTPQQASTPSSKSTRGDVGSGNSNGASGMSVVDVLRVLGGILVLSCGMSYLATGESLTWGWNPWYLRLNEWKAIIQGEIRLTDTQLLAYDGTDPTKPIYLALNGTIYDVSANPKTYGPKGSYHHFAGHDSARAFITGCFMEDQTPDLRGVEEMYVPVDAEDAEEPKQTYDAETHRMSDVEADADKVKKERANDKRRKLTKAQLKVRREREFREGRKRVAETLEGWHKLFRGEKGKPYFRVGTVVREPGWLERLPRRELCEHARSSRPVRGEGD